MQHRNLVSIQVLSFLILMIFLTLAFVANADCGLRSKTKLVKLPMPQPILVPLS